MSEALFPTGTKTMTKIIQWALVASLFALTGCNNKAEVVSSGGDSMPFTLKANEKFAQDLNLEDQQAFEDAKRGFIARPEGKILDADGNVLVDFDDFKFVEGKAPPTVNPSLWRHAILNAQIGLFKVTDGIYQLRGFDVGNMTLIEGKTGWIVVDALTCRESAAAALAFARKHLGDKPVSAIVFTHSHIDHFGGAMGVLSAREVAERNIPVVAPEGFMEEATSENVMVGTAMGRRSLYQFGKNLERSPKGMVDTGLGKAVAYGSFGIFEPTQLITQASQEMMLDAVRLINAGYTPREIADKIKLPRSLGSYLGVLGYYGDLRHNVKAVYQFYLGAYDGNPANLNPLPPQESAKRYLEIIGGADKAVAA